LSPSEEFFRTHLVGKFGISYMFYECSTMVGALAFMNLVNARIKEEYGEDFISNERSKAKVLFEK
jgi:hypothetical protein